MPTNIDALRKQINAKYKDQILVQGMDLKIETWERATTGSLVFDLMLGGGWPLNVWNEVIGQESSGKTTIAYKTIAEQQRLNPQHQTVWVASEDINPMWAETLGVDLARVEFVQTNVMEIAFDVMLAAATERVADAIVVDSYPALVPTEEDEKSMEEFTVGRGALLTNKFFRKVGSTMRRSLTDPDRSCLYLMINQWRDRIGVIGRADPRITPGGKGKNYSFFTRVDVTRIDWIKNSGKDKVGQVMKATTMKNKTAPPQRVGEVDFYFDDHKEHEAGSYDTTKQTHALGLTLGVIEQRGAWYYFQDQQWQGLAATMTALQTDHILSAAVDSEVRRILLGTAPPPPPEKPRRTRTPRKQAA